MLTKSDESISELTVAISYISKQYVDGLLEMQESCPRQGNFLLLCKTKEEKEKDERDRNWRDTKVVYWEMGGLHPAGHASVWLSL